MSYLQILNKLTQKKLLSSLELEVLLQEELTNINQCQAFKITQSNGLGKINNRAKLFRETHKELEKTYQKLELERNDILSILWRFWLPLSIQLAEKRNKLERPLIQGILGGQGTGKTTLSTIIRLILKQLGYTTIDISLDDLYKTYAERQKLKAIDPRLIWRGPPGTHDIELGIKVLNQLRDPHNSQPISIPRFDKSLWNGQGDRIEPEIIKQADIILFEGWFLGVSPIDETNFNNSPDPIKTEEDRQFAKDINQKLKDYLPLWKPLDSLMVLYPLDYHFSKEWRKEAEQQMIASGKTGMSEQEIDEFVDYFWKSLHPELFITSLLQNSKLVDLVIEINSDHSPGNVYKRSFIL
ncbi:glycerate kinase [Crocosphaera sp. UHCC 0190]|uniref:glycerate kinase n=1 Tax=Crocosphaera sp. UHCC 0190 TaxID=3110246 RepID=UPI002B2157C5|nr:glycerate kinase [Crocosphaera sp. UHCC 0190]MEA5512104.1 glycerate kinase [Crocosphaera sp. UHCC 0190]